MNDCREGLAHFTCLLNVVRAAVTEARAQVVAEATSERDSAAKLCTGEPTRSNYIGAAVAIVDAKVVARAGRR